MQKKFILLGASRGLGWATYQHLFTKDKQDSFLLSSRQIVLKQDQIKHADTKLIAQDFSKAPIQNDFYNQLLEFKATHLIYFAGGGPFGNFSEKKWSDHMWALNTSFLYPAELLHCILRDLQKWSSLKQIIVVGSSVAESKPDPKAASYAAAKHALKGLVETLQLEQQKPLISLFSPGYMQTDLLPPNSQPRQNNLAENPVDVAKKLIAMLEKND